MPDVYRYIATKIKGLRSSFSGKGMSQEDLAKLMGTTANTISRWETATYRPSVAELDRLSRIFGVPITVFFPQTAKIGSQVQALLSATGELRGGDMDEVIRYAQFRKARKLLRESRKRRNKA